MRTFALPIALCLGLALAPAGAAELTVYATGSMEVPLHQLGEEFTHATGHTLKFELGTTGVVMNKLKTGKADVIEVRPQEGAATRIFLEAESHMPLMMTTTVVA